VRLQSAQQQRQSVMAPCTTASSLVNVVRIATFVQQIMTKFNAAELEEKIVGLTKIVINL